MFDELYKIDEIDKLISYKQKRLEDEKKLLASQDSIKDEYVRNSQIGIIQLGIDKVTEELKALEERRKTLGQEINLKKLLQESIEADEERKNLQSIQGKQIEELNKTYNNRPEETTEEYLEKLDNQEKSLKSTNNKIREVDFKINKINSILKYFSPSQLSAVYSEMFDEMYNRKDALREENDQKNFEEPAVEKTESKEESEEPISVEYTTSYEPTPAMQEIIDMVEEYYRYNEKEEELKTENTSLIEEILDLNKQKEQYPDKASIVDTRIGIINEIISKNHNYIEILQDWKKDIDKAMNRFSEEDNAKAFKYVQENKSSIVKEMNEEAGAEILIDIKKLEDKWVEVVKGKDASNEEIYKYSSELARAYEKQVKRYDKLLEKYITAPPEYRHTIKLEREKAENSMLYFQQKTEENKPEDIIQLDDHTIEQLQEEILQAQEKINETEKKLDEAAKNKEFFTTEAIRLSNELREKNEELITIINEYQENDAKELKELEIKQAKERLEIASQNKLKYENLTKELEEELSQTKALIVRNKELVSTRVVTAKDLEGLKDKIIGKPEEFDPDIHTVVLDPFVDPQSEPAPPVSAEPTPVSQPEPQPEPVQPINPEPTPVSPQEPTVTEGRVLEQILVDIYIDKETGEPINVTHIQRKRLERSNISVTRNFLNDVKNGNTLYDIMSFIPATIIHAPVSLFQKISGILLTTQRTRDRVAKIRKNIQDLPDEDKKVLFKKYKNARAFEDRAKGADGIIKEEAMEYLRTKEIAPRVNEAGNIFTEAFESYKLYRKYTNVIEQLENGLPLEAVKAIPGKVVNVENATKEDLINTLKEVRDSIVVGQAAKIRKFQELNDELAELYSGSGLHSIEEEERAKSTKMNERGKRFATDVGTADDFEGRKMRADVQGALKEALDDGKDLDALLLFVKNEQLKLSASEQGMTYVRILKGNPLIPQGIPIFPAGIGEKGTINYMPIAQEMDYRPDPFIRNMISTLAITTTLVNSISQIHQNVQASKINAENSKIEADIHAHGKELESHQDALNEGMSQQRELSFAAERNQTELHDQYWNPNANYSVDDPAHHLDLRDAYKTVNNNINKINDKVASGDLTPVEGLNQIRELNNQVHSQYVGVLKESLPNIQKYAETHPEFDYNVLIPSIKKMIDNPHGLDVENQALLDSIQTGGSLQEIAIKELPSNIALPIIGLGGAALITGYAASLAQKGFNKKEDTLTQFVEDSIKLDKELSGQVELTRSSDLPETTVSEPVSTEEEPSEERDELFERMLRNFFGENNEPQQEPVRSMVHK